MMVEIISSLLYTPLVIRSLGKQEYGVYSWVMSITAYLYLLDLGIGNSIVKFAAQYRIQGRQEKQRGFVGIITCYYLIVAVVLIGIGVLVSNNFSLILDKGFNDKELKIVKQLFWVMIFNAAATLFFGAYQKILLAYEKFVLSKWLDIFKVILRMILGILALYTGKNSYGMVVANLCVTIVIGIISFEKVVFNLKIIPSIKHIEANFVKEIVGFSNGVLLQGVATQLNSMVDQVLIGVIVPGASVILAVYGTGILIPQYIQNIAVNVNGVLMPGIVRMIEERRDVSYIEREMIRVSRILFMMLAVIGIVFGVFGKLFIKLWVGDGYEDAFWVAIIIMIPRIIICSEEIGSQILWAIEKHKLQGFLKLSIAIANVGLSILLIKWKPLLGATLATALVLILGDILVMNFVFKRYIGISVKRYSLGIIENIWKCLGITFVVGNLIKGHMPSTWLGFIVGCTIMISVYIITMWKFGLNEYEKELAGTFLQKLRISH